MGRVRCLRNGFTEVSKQSMELPKPARSEMQRKVAGLSAQIHKRTETPECLSSVRVHTCQSSPGVRYLSQVSLVSWGREKEEKAGGGGGEGREERRQPRPPKHIHYYSQ